MKILFLLFFVTSLFGEIIEGKDYIKLSNPMPNAEHSLIKIFSYDCPFCFKFDSITKDLVDSLPKNMSFEEYHLSQRGEFGNEASELFAVLIVRDKRLRESNFDMVKKAYYEAYHIKKQHWNNKESFLNFGLELVGINKSEFERLKDNNDVKDLLILWKNAYDIAKIQGIPAFVVNGKYLIILKQIRNIQSLINIINELNAKE
ncbi:thiol:disulfide interchange protein DsbA/DsbL [Helicobacter sp. MIT 14-3879]|uniref:thiol:disulfide interchange protein DsbA/DsbL n=1 Tax=Helicobacter sp. MIT 14-3879 TaxID=2040649 RepID=UPI000E1F13B8|nr:thiol:disulfide interchange protein DsbA/DsbL [Helicobacter sp. MIT 14-3879]RDU64739.1 thiol:disulfide interchange protein [Helicobacter sp. MIT 14-3879]